MPDPKESTGKVAEDTNAVEADDDGYSSAFAEAAEMVGEKADLHKVDDPGEDDKPGKGEKPVVPPVIPPVEKPDDKSAIDASARQPGEDEETYKQRYLTLQGTFKHDKSAWEQERTKLLSDLEEAKKPKTPDEKKEVEKKETASADAFIASLTPEEQEQLNQYEADFDVVSKMEGIKRDRELAKLRKEMTEWQTGILAQLTEAQAKLAPAVKMVEENEIETHFNVIRNGYKLEDGTVVAGHPDFDKYRDDGSMVKWIEGKPAYLKTALLKVYQKGSAQDVIDLYSDFKRENNIETALPVSRDDDKVVNMNVRRAEKKSALQAVHTRRGAVNTGKSIVDDYEGAWEEAANK